MFILFVHFYLSSLFALPQPGKRSNMETKFSQLSSTIYLVGITLISFFLPQVTSSMIVSGFFAQ